MNKQVKSIIFDYEGVLINDLDEPNSFLVDIIEVLADSYDIVVISNSDEQRRMEIEGWLYEHGVMADQVLLRPSNNYETGWKLSEISERFSLDEVCAIVDDSETFCDAARAAGYFVMMV